MAMTCPRCGAALQKLDRDTNGWLIVVRAVFTCGHSEYVAAEPGPERVPERTNPAYLHETDALCHHCQAPLGRVRAKGQRVHAACAPAWGKVLGARRRATQRAWHQAHQRESGGR